MITAIIAIALTLLLITGTSYAEENSSSSLNRSATRVAAYISQTDTHGFSDLLMPDFSDKSKGFHNYERLVEFVLFSIILFPKQTTVLTDNTHAYTIINMVVIRSDDIISQECERINWVLYNNSWRIYSFSYFRCP